MAASVCAFAPTAQAATIAVTTTADGIADDGACGLREAVNAANDDAAVGGCPPGNAADTITVPAGTYTLTALGSRENVGLTGDLDFRSAVTLRGAGASATVIDANQTDRALETNFSAVVVINGLTITNGLSPKGRSPAVTTGTDPNATTVGPPGEPGGDGGAIANNGSLTLSNSRVTNSQAGAGGSGGDAVAPDGTTSSPGGSGGDARGGDGGPGGNGGGIYNNGTLTVTGSAITGNRAGFGRRGGRAAPGQGGESTGGDGARGGWANGGLFGYGANGGAGGSGGGVYNSAFGELKISTSTIEGNAASPGGAGRSPRPANGSSSNGPGEGGTGGAGKGGDGGRGGSGGGVAGDGIITIEATSVSYNVAGNGGPAAPSQGGNGAAGAGSGDHGGAGGDSSGGRGGDGGAGGGVYATGTTTLSRVALLGNKTGDGAAGALGSAGLPGPATPSNMNASGAGGRGGSGGDGGGLGGPGQHDFKLTDVTVDGNGTGSGQMGGAGYGSGSAPGFWTMAGSGGAAGSAGAIDGAGGPLSVKRATISRNTLGAPGPAGMTNGPVAGIPGAAGVASALRAGGTTRVSATIFDSNEPVSSGRCSGEIEDGGSNIDLPADPGCPGSVEDPELGPLADNGGPTLTRALPPTSSALDRYGCSGLDQRGAVRPANGRCDIGAYELTPPRAAPVAPPKAVSSSAAILSAEVKPSLQPTTVVFDYGPSLAYGSTTAPTTVPAGKTAVKVEAEATGLLPLTTYHFRSRAMTADGTATSPDRVFTTPAGPPPPEPQPVDPSPGAGPGAPPSGPGGPPSGPGPGAPDASAPVITKLRLTRAKFAVAKDPTPRTAVARAAKRVPRGTKISFRVSEAATVRLEVARRAVGKKARANGRTVCKYAKRRPGRSARCDRYVTAGVLTRTASEAGAHSVAFTGRIGAKPLARAAYRLTVIAIDASGNRSRAKRVTFEVVRPGAG